MQQAPLFVEAAKAAAAEPPTAETAARFAACIRGLWDQLPELDEVAALAAIEWGRCWATRIAEKCRPDLPLVDALAPMLTFPLEQHSNARTQQPIRKFAHFASQLKALSQAAAAELAEDPNSSWQHPALFDDPAWSAFRQHADGLLDSLYQQSISDVEARRGYVETIRVQVEKRLRSRYRTTQVHIFGSSLMGLETALSDVDFMADIRGVMPPDTDIQEVQAHIEELEASLPDFVQLRIAVHDWKRKLATLLDTSVSGIGKLRTAYNKDVNRIANGATPDMAAFEKLRKQLSDRLSFNIRLKELVAAITTEMCRQYAEASCGRYRAEAVFAELFRTKLDTARERQLLEAVATQQRAAVQDGDEEDEKDQGQDDEGEDHEGDFSLVAGDLPDDGQDVNDELQSEQRALIQQLFTRAKSLDQLKAARDRQKKSVLFTIAKVLQMDFPRVTCVTRARVGLVQFRTAEVEQQVDCDLVVNNQLGHRNSTLIRAYASLHPKVHQLMHLIKLWTKTMKIADAKHGLLASYTYMVMCIHYLLRIGAIPNLQEHGRPAGAELLCCIRGYDTYFSTSSSLRVNLNGPYTSITALFYGFLKYFSEYKFRHWTITTRGRGESISKSLWKKSPLWRWSVEDPFERVEFADPHDLGVVLNMSGQERILSAFKESVLPFEQLSPGQFEAWIESMQRTLRPPPPRRAKATKQPKPAQPAVPPVHIDLSRLVEQFAAELLPETFAALQASLSTTAVNHAATQDLGRVAAATIQNILSQFQMPDHIRSSLVQAGAAHIMATIEQFRAVGNRAMPQQPVRYPQRPPVQQSQQLQPPPQQQEPVQHKQRRSRERAPKSQVTPAPAEAEAANARPAPRPQQPKAHEGKNTQQQQQQQPSTKKRFVIVPKKAEQTAVEAPSQPPQATQSTTQAAAPEPTAAPTAAAERKRRPRSNHKHKQEHKPAGAKADDQLPPTESKKRQHQAEHHQVEHHQTAGPEHDQQGDAKPAQRKVFKYRPKRGPKDSAAAGKAAQSDKR